MPREAELKRETIVDARTGAASGTTTTLVTLTEIGGLALEHLDQITFNLAIATAIAGTTPTMDVYIQAAVVPSPDATNDAHWDDYAKFTQHVPADSTQHKILVLAYPGAAATVTSATATSSHVRGVQQGGFTAGNAFPYHWGDTLRIREVMGGTITTAPIYSIHATARMD